MARTDFTLHRDTLLALRARLRGDMTQMVDAALTQAHNATGGAPTDLPELGTDAFGQELTLTLLGSEKDVLQQVDAALERIADGSYGRCEDCGKKIPEARLEALPYAACCVQCASKQEAAY